MRSAGNDNSCRTRPCCDVRGILQAQVWREMGGVGNLTPRILAEIVWRNLDTLEQRRLNSLQVSKVWLPVCPKYGAEIREEELKREKFCPSYYERAREQRPYFDPLFISFHIEERLRCLLKQGIELEEQAQSRRLFTIQQTFVKILIITTVFRHSMMDGNSDLYPEHTSFMSSCFGSKKHDCSQRYLCKSPVFIRLHLLRLSKKGQVSTNPSY